MWGGGGVDEGVADPMPGDGLPSHGELTRGEGIEEAERVFNKNTSGI